MTQDLLYTSPSAIDKARVCIRRWAWDQVDKLPYVQSAEAEFGDKAHAMREAYFRDGTPPDESTQEGRAAAHGLAHLPHPGISTRAEVKAEFDHEGVRIFMRVDLLEQDEMHDPAEWLVIYDHKFVKDLHKGWHDRAEALNDPQFIAYMVWAFKKYPHLDKVGARWVYTTRPVLSERTGRYGSIKSEPRDLDVTRAEAFEAWDRVCKPVTQVMYQIRKKKVHPLALPPNADACYMYGPRYACPRVGQCNLTDSDQLKGDQVIMEDVLEQLRALAASSETPPPAAPKSAPAADDIAARLAASIPGQAVGVNPPPRTTNVVPSPEQVANVKAATDSPNKFVPEHSDAELGRAVRLLFAALRGA